MKNSVLIFFGLALLISGCRKEDENPLFPSVTKATINETSFIPEKSVVLKSGRRYIILFTREKQKLEIITSDTIPGEYEVTDSQVKAAIGLQVMITYTDESGTYYGKHGSVVIMKTNNGDVAGTYNATVSGNGYTYEISDGSFESVKADSTRALIENEAAIRDSLDACYESFYGYVRFSYVFDAVYSNTVSAPDESWNEIYGHLQTQASENEKVFSLWNDAFDLIFRLNLIMESSELFLPESTARNNIIGQAIAIRACLNYCLMTWFGEIPVETELFPGNNPRSPVTELISRISSDAEESIDCLPDEWSGMDIFRISDNLMRALLARVYLTDFELQTIYPTPSPCLYGNSFRESITHARQIINSGKYSLEDNPLPFSSSDRQIIWGFEKGDNPEFNTVFDKGPYVPFIRLTEIYLILAEALLQNQETEAAKTVFNELNYSLGRPLVSSLNPEDIYLLWNSEMATEGSTFLTRRRFNKALPFVDNNATRILLPVPMPAIIRNPYLTQNPGY